MNNCPAYANIALLSQMDKLLQTIDDTVYTRHDPTMFPSSIGKHVRHDLEHYLNLIHGRDSATVDYENRARDAHLEKCRDAARSTISEIIAHLETLTVTDAEMTLTMRPEGAGASPDDGDWITSTLARELDFLMSHTVHHQGLISMILRIQGQQPETGFGVAPSTLRHEHKACAQ